MRQPESNVISLRLDAATIAPERPCWAVHEDWVVNEKGRRLRPGVYWHGFKRTAADDEADDEKTDRPITDEWIATPVTVAARTTNSDDGSEGRLLRLVTESGTKEWIIPMEVFGGSGEDARRQLFEAAHGYGLSRVIKALDGAGALAKRDTDRDSRKTKKYRIPGGGSLRLYVIDPEVMDSEGGSV